MKRIITVILSILMLSVFLTGFSSVTENKEVVGPVERYRYPIDITSEDWFEYSVIEKSDMLMIPQETLDDMSDLQLLYAIADYPYFCDAFFYGLDKDGLAVFAKYCSAFNELLSRDSFLESLNTYGKAIAQEYLSDLSNTLNVAKADLILNLMAFYSDARSGSTRNTPIVVYTPNGTAVSATIETETHTEEDEINWHFFRDQSMIDTYGVEKVSPGSCIYNCHAYAWSYPSTSCPYWISNPANYMTDGSYSLVYSGTVNGIVSSSYGIRSGDIVYYPASTDKNDHSAILLRTPSAGARIGSVLAISKWGHNALFRHTVDNMPVECQSINISIWQQR